MAFVQFAAVIPVDLAVTRYRILPEDGMVEVWGHVGDYEICVHLTVEDARSRGLLRLEAMTPRKRKKDRP